ncbi:MAG: hypothetical protein MJE66_24425 [Proteobacteria bacterium]|nr:hypothetical protein [Pseudomonadota bacterium]
MALVGSLYALSTIAFGTLGIAIGIRLLALARRTGGAPERRLGLGIMLTSGCGYMVMVIAAMLGEIAPDRANLSYAYALWLLGAFCHNLGVLAILAFILSVFRPHETWAKGLAGTMGAVLWLSAGADLLSGHPPLNYGPYYWWTLSVTGTYQLWMSAESLRHYAQGRRRLALGLAQPLVVNRFLLWGLASLMGTAAIWSVNVPGILTAGEAVMADPATQLSLVVTAAFGMLTVSLYWLTFFPPRWYRKRLSIPDAGSAS